MTVTAGFQVNGKDASVEDTGAPVEVAPVELYPVAEDAGAILSQDTIKRQIVPVPAWRLSVEIRAVTIQQMEQATLAAQVADDQGNSTADGRRLNRLLFALSVIRPAFTADQVEKLFSEQSAEATGTVLEAIMQINGLGASFGLSVAATAPATFRGAAAEQP